MVLSTEEQRELERLLRACGVPTLNGHPNGWIGLFTESRANVVSMQRSIGQYRKQAKLRGQKLPARPLPTGFEAVAHDRAIEEAGSGERHERAQKPIVVQEFKRAPRRAGKLRRALRVLLGRD